MCISKNNGMFVFFIVDELKLFVNINKIIVELNDYYD